MSSDEYVNLLINCFTFENFFFKSDLTKLIALSLMLLYAMQSSKIWYFFSYFYIIFFCACVMLDFVNGLLCNIWNVLEFVFKVSLRLDISRIFDCISVVQLTWLFWSGVVSRTVLILVSQGKIFYFAFFPLNNHRSSTICGTTVGLGRC